MTTETFFCKNCLNHKKVETMKIDDSGRKMCTPCFVKLQRHTKPLKLGRSIITAEQKEKARRNAYNDPKAKQFRESRFDQWLKTVQ